MTSFQVKQKLILLSDKFQIGIIYLSDNSQRLLKMGAPVKIIAENINEDALKKYYYEYMSRDSRKDDSDSCEICNLPKLFHIDNRGELVIAPCDV